MKFSSHRARTAGGHRHGHQRPRTAAVPGTQKTHFLLLGPVRFLLGMIQMAFALIAIVELLLHGISLAALVCAAVSSMATLLSRLLYRGHSGPDGRKF